ncbi:EamA family transporter [Candidatus Beckwithbacteria bacterium]|nr:EamA family transporter [Candidatus Beckwithbacteria bacterium]
MSPIILAWVASVTYGLYTITAKLIGKYQIKNSYQFSFFSILFSSIIMSVIAYLYGGRLAVSWPYIIFAALATVIGETLYLIALKTLDVSVMSPLFNIRVAITVILSFFILNDTAH